MLDALLQVLVPSAIVFGVTGIVVVAIVLAIRTIRRGSRARAAAEAERAIAGGMLVKLDAAVEELELEAGFSSAFSDPTHAAPLRRARMAAQHARDEAFDDYRALSETNDPAELPERRRLAQRITHRGERALEAIAAARAAHAAWLQSTVDASTQVAAVRSHFVAITTELGDPGAPVAELAARVDETEWAEAAGFASSARAALAEADRSIDVAEAMAERARVDPSVPLLPTLARAESALRRGQTAARALEESHRLGLQAAAGVAGELLAARAALGEAQLVRQHLTEASTDPTPEAAEHLGDAIREAEESIARLESGAARRPVATVNELAHVRARLDLAQGDARTAQQRLRGARSALPGTLAAARNAVARAEAAVASAPRASAESRVRLAAAAEELTRARQGADPVESLDAARRAMRHAEDAAALAAIA